MRRIRDAGRAVDRRGTERASAGWDDGQGGRRRARGGGERDHPRDAQAPCESGKAGESCSLRPGHLAVLRRVRGTGTKG